MKRKLAFTLSEVLLTLVIIGLIAALTVPTISKQIKWAQYHSALFKAKSVLEQATMKFSSENGNFVECGYWIDNPYASATCKGYDNKGNCTGWVYKETGENLPSDYNGRFADCKKLYDYWIQNMNVIKVCDSNAYSSGCMPKDMKGVDTIYQGKNSGVTDFDMNKATAGLSGFRQASLRAGKSFITADGFTFYPYSGYGMPIILVDLNGMKGPNKWGHDIHGFIARIKNQDANPSLFPYIQSTQYVEAGGRTTFHLLYKKTR